VNALLGLPEPLPRFRPGRLATGVRRNEHRDELIRARTTAGEDGEALLRPLEGQESHMMVRSGTADALVYVESGTGELAADSTVRYLELV
jgi:molybdopterin biosynthesis enzyme